MTPDYVGAVLNPSPNYWTGRNGLQPQYIVMHGTAGLMPGCLGWLDSPQSVASVHYLVDQQGVIHQLVSEENSAWGNGVVSQGGVFPAQPNPNYFTISIEHERDSTNTSPITPAQQAASTALVADIRRRWGTLPVVPHSAIDPVNRPFCPGNDFPMTEIDQGGGIAWVSWSTTPIHVPLTFYNDASTSKALYTSAAGTGTVLAFDGLRYGQGFVNPKTGQMDHRWAHRHNPTGTEGWVPAAYLASVPSNLVP